jgi:large subunit ribosomal protein L30
MSEVQKIEITLKRSLIGIPAKIKKVAIALGLKRINQTVERAGTPSILGMVEKVKHLVSVEKR